MHCSKEIEVILTINTKEKLAFSESDFNFPMCFIQNKEKEGFGTNHNKAFNHAKGKYFCVLNPDVRLNANPFSALIDCFEDKTVGVAAPLITDETGKIGENARKYPSPLSLFKKLLHLNGKYDYSIGSNYFFTGLGWGYVHAVSMQSFQGNQRV
jgi:GT2 family glycosyltransferase